MQTTDYDFEFDKSLIAQVPVEPRDISRLMVITRQSNRIEHYHFYDLPKFLESGDLIIFNNSRVFPSRLVAQLSKSEAKVEITLLHNISPNIWMCLARPGKKMKSGDKFEIRANNKSIRGEVIATEESGAKILKFDKEEHLSDLGVVALPPYIKEPLVDPERYQTVYSKISGSVAAPTAGLHFTPELMEKIRATGAKPIFLTLHVGWDSFRLIRSKSVESHTLNSEYYEISEEAANEINNALLQKRRIISIGTTSVRLLEHVAKVNSLKNLPIKTTNLIAAGSGWADTFITPGYTFRVVSSLVTNFHLPKSTLLMLTCAFGGRNLIMQAYAEASDMKYRFYSFGDAMMII